MMESIDLHGLNQAETRLRLAEALAGAARRGERVVKIVHGQGLHSEQFPVLKSFVRRWLDEDSQAKLLVQAVFRGEDGSPYTRPNAGETVVLLRGTGSAGAPAELGWEEEEAREARKQAKGMRAEKRKRPRR